MTNDAVQAQRDEILLAFHELTMSRDPDMAAAVRARAEKAYDLQQWR